MISVRPAGTVDIPDIVDMSQRFYATTSYADFAPMCPETVSRLAATLIDTGVMLVAEADDDILVGMVGLFVAPFLFNNSETTAHEVVWWVAPSEQGLGVGQKLLAAIEPACLARGAKAIQMVHLHNSPPQAGALYEKLGYRMTESYYTKEIG